MYLKVAIRRICWLPPKGQRQPRFDPPFLFVNSGGYYFALGPNSVDRPRLGHCSGRSGHPRPNIGGHVLLLQLTILLFPRRQVPSLPRPPIHPRPAACFGGSQFALEGDRSGSTAETGVAREVREHQEQSSVSQPVMKRRAHLCYCPHFIIPPIHRHLPTSAHLHLRPTVYRTCAFAFRSSSAQCTRPSRAARLQNVKNLRPRSSAGLRLLALPSLALQHTADPANAIYRSTPSPHTTNPPSTAYHVEAR